MAFRPPPVYALTDPARSGTPQADQVERLLAAGLRLIQVRDKEASGGDLLAALDAGVDLGLRAGGLLLANDRPDLARLSGAGGVHLGEEDLPPGAARSVLGAAAVIGCSSHDAASAKAAESAGADYVAIGPVRTTRTKADAGAAVGLAAVREVRAAVGIPVVAIGGIGLDSAAEVLAAGADSVAVVSDIAAAPDPAARAAAWAARFPEPGPRRGLVFLTGFMGSGKSTVGAALARRLGRRFVDLDRVVQERAGMTIPEIFSRRGEPAFRDLEAEALDGIPRGADAVMALGGGTLLRPGPARRVASLGRLIWLDCPAQESLARCGEPGERPLLDDPAALRRLHRERLPGYRRADHRVEAGGDDPERVAAAIVPLL